jgi:16S rRNA (adenine1518-N6/adenine1519-N6)-dimethyltransferase
MKAHKNFKLIFADVLQWNPAEVFREDASYHVVANIPYYITGKILQMFLQSRPKPKSMTLLVQKEVAQNLTARPGAMNLLALSVQLRGTAKLLFPVPRRYFFPVPKVDSAVVQIVLPSKPPVLLEDEKKFFSLVKACFAGKRKQLHNTLMNNARVPKEQVQATLQLLSIDPAVRPQTLSLEDWLRLYAALYSKGA